jgi:hypothetical protein
VLRLALGQHHADQVEVDALRVDRRADGEPAGGGVVGDDVGHRELVVVVAGVEDLDPDRHAGRGREHVGW